jgi:rhodanese-related sulfurtransferase
MNVSLLLSFSASSIVSVSPPVSQTDTHQPFETALMGPYQPITKETDEMKKGFKQLLAEANEAIVTYSVEEARALLASEDVLFVDIRDQPELERDGQIPGAIHASRGMLEFLVDPESPYHNPAFAAGKNCLLYCASGGRSALAARQIQEMGLSAVAHIGGGLKAWKESGGPVASFQAAA